MRTDAALGRMGITRAALVLTVVAAVAGCGGDAGARAADPLVRDSAGVRIVENPAELPAELVWTAVEAVSIGSVDGDLDETFNRVADIGVTEAGRVYVLDPGDNVVKVYDAGGAHVITFGGEGEGPAEFRGASRLALRGDSVVVFDFRLMKLASFDADGGLLGTARTELSVSAYVEDADDRRRWCGSGHGGARGRTELAGHLRRAFLQYGACARTSPSQSRCPRGRPRGVR
jgi:hypothetical protein